MTVNQESELVRSIRQIMQLKDSEELLAIWKKNDRQEWSDEAFSIIHDILLERLGTVPPQVVDAGRRKRNKKVTKKSGIPWLVIVLFSPAVLVLALLLLIPAINPGPEDTWFSVLMLSSMALFFFLPGFYFGWKCLFQRKETLKRMEENVPNMKKSWGFFYHFFTYFLPDRLVPGYFLVWMGFMAIMLIFAGVRTIMFLFKVI
jgi:hypothetical protein